MTTPHLRPSSRHRTDRVLPTSRNGSILKSELHALIDALYCGPIFGPGHLSVHDQAQWSEKVVFDRGHVQADIPGMRRIGHCCGFDDSGLLVDNDFLDGGILRSFGSFQFVAVIAEFNDQIEARTMERSGKGVADRGCARTSCRGAL